MVGRRDAADHPRRNLHRLSRHLATIGANIVARRGGGAEGRNLGHIPAAEAVAAVIVTAVQEENIRSQNEAKAEVKNVVEHHRARRKAITIAAAGGGGDKKERSFRRKSLLLKGIDLRLSHHHHRLIVMVPM